MTISVPPTTRGAELHLMSLQGEGAHRCSFPFAGNVPGSRTNDAMAGLLTRRSSLFGRLPGDLSSGLQAASSRLTVAGTASELHRVPSWPSVGRHHLRLLWGKRPLLVNRKRSKRDISALSLSLATRYSVVLLSVMHPSGYGASGQGQARRLKHRYVPY